jgi:glucose-6-phosphate dehydrogenase assembly protein OpcA
MSNLVVVRAERDDAAADRPPDDGPVVAEVARRHPARAILLEYHARQPRACEPASTHIAVLVFGAAPRRYGVEMIAVEAICAEASIPSIVRRLVRGGVPTSVWWTGDLCDPVPPVELTTLGRQLVFDSARCTHGYESLLTAGALAARAHAPEVVDLNWRRLEPMRRAFTHALRAAERPSVRPSYVTVTHSPADIAIAWLLAAWLQAELQWQAGEMPLLVAQEGAELSVTVTTPPRIRAARLGATVSVDVQDRPTFVVPVPHEQLADAVAAELNTLTEDRGLHAALVALHEHLKDRKDGLDR